MISERQRFRAPDADATRVEDTATRVAATPWRCALALPATRPAPQPVHLECDVVFCLGHRHALPILPGHLCMSME